MFRRDLANISSPVIQALVGDQVMAQSSACTSTHTPVVGQLLGVTRVTLLDWLWNWLMVESHLFTCSYSALVTRSSRACILLRIHLQPRGKDSTLMSSPQITSELNTYSPTLKADTINKSQFMLFAFLSFSLMLWFSSHQPRALILLLNQSPTCHYISMKTTTKKYTAKYLQ